LCKGSKVCPHPFVFTLNCFCFQDRISLTLLRLVSSL
jgi:hypothetical protein